MLCSRISTAGHTKGEPSRIRSSVGASPARAQRGVLGAGHNSWRDDSDLRRPGAPAQELAHLKRCARLTPPCDWGPDEASATPAPAGSEGVAAPSASLRSHDASERLGARASAR